MTSLVGLTLCLPSPFWYVFLLLLFPLISHYMHSCPLITLKWNICVRRVLLSVLLLILPICLGRSIPTALMALLGSVLLGAIQMSRATPSLKAPGWWVVFYPCSLSFLLLHPNTCSNNLIFKIQPTILDLKELVWLTGNLKLEMIEYSRQLYGGKDGEEEDDDGGDGAGGLESTPSHQPRKRRFWWSYTDRHRHRHRHSIV